MKRSCYALATFVLFSCPSQAGVTVQVTSEGSCCICLRSYSIFAASAAAITTNCSGYPFGSAIESDAVAWVGDPDACPGIGNDVIAFSEAFACAGECGYQIFAGTAFSVSCDSLYIRFDQFVFREPFCNGPFQIITDAGYADSGGEFEFDTDSCSVNIEFGGDVELPESLGDSSEGRKFTFLSYGIIAQSPCDRSGLWYIQTAEGDLGNGIDSNGNVDYSTTCSGEIELSVVITSGVTDSQLDADGNGRFNERDWHLIEALLGSSFQNDLDKYNLHIETDLNDNGDLSDDQVIAQVDLDIIRSMLDSGLGAGEFGDWDGDGVVDCDDYNAVPTTLSATIGDANYRVELDYDLDGDNDSADRSALDALYPTADIAAPFGILDLTDLTTFITAHANQDPIADLAPDYGIWDLADLTSFVTAFNTPCP